MAVKQEADRLHWELEKRKRETGVIQVASSMRECYQMGTRAISYSKATQTSASVAVIRGPADIVGRAVVPAPEEERARILFRGGDGVPEATLYASAPPVHFAAFGELALPEHGLHRLLQLPRGRRS